MIIVGFNSEKTPNLLTIFWKLSSQQRWNSFMIQLQVFPLKWQSYSRLFQVIKQHKNFAVAWKKILNWLLVLQR